MMRDVSRCNGGDVAVLAMHAAYAANSAAASVFSSPADLSSSSSSQSSPASPRLAGRSDSPPPPASYFQHDAAAPHFHYPDAHQLPFPSVNADMLPFFPTQQQQLYSHQTAADEPAKQEDRQERPQGPAQSEEGETVSAAGNATSSGSKRRRVQSAGSPGRAVKVDDKQQQAAVQAEQRNGHHESGRDQRGEEEAAEDEEDDNGVEEDEEIVIDAGAASDASSLSSSSLSGSPPSSPSGVVSSFSPTAASQLASSNGSSATTPSHNSGLTPASSPSHHSKVEIPPALNKSIIECGVLDLLTGARQLSHHSAYFNKVVEVYTAVNDPQRRTLYRASALAEKFSCATNKVGMYLARRRHCESGLWQSVGFRFKPSGRTGLKAGGYFLSQEICESFQWHFMKQVGRKRGRAATKEAEAAAAAGGSDDKTRQQLQQQKDAKVKQEPPADDSEKEATAGGQLALNGLGEGGEHGEEEGEGEAAGGGAAATAGQSTARVKQESAEHDDFAMRRDRRDDDDVEHSNNDAEPSDDEHGEAEVSEDEDGEQRRGGAAEGLPHDSLESAHHILSSPTPPLSAALGLPYSALTLDPSAAYSPHNVHPLTHPHALSHSRLPHVSNAGMEHTAELIAAAQQQQLSQRAVYHNNGMLSSLPGSAAQHAHAVVKQQQEEDEDDALSRSGLLLQDGLYGHLLHQHPHAHLYAGDGLAGRNGSVQAALLSGSMHGQMERSSSTGMHHPVLLPLSHPSMLSPQQQQRMALMEHRHQQQLQMQMQMLPPSHSLVHSQSFPHLQHSVDGHLEHLQAQRRLQAVERLHAQQQHMRALSAQLSPQRLHPPQLFHQLEMDAAAAAHQQQMQQLQQMHQQQQMEMEQHFYLQQQQQEQTAMAALTQPLPPLSLSSTSPLPHSHSASTSPVSLSPLPSPRLEDVYAMADGRMQL